MNLKERNIAVSILLSIVTCGIYALIWYIFLMKEACSVKDETDSGIVEIILLFVFFPVSFFLAEKKLAEGCAARGIAHEDRSVLYLILSLLGLGIVCPCMMQSDLNAIAKMYAPAEQQYQQY